MELIISAPPKGYRHRVKIRKLIPHFPETKEQEGAVRELVIMGKDFSPDHERHFSVIEELLALKDLLYAIIEDCSPVIEECSSVVEDCSLTIMEQGLSLLNGCKMALAPSSVAMPGNKIIIEPHKIMYHG